MEIGGQQDNLISLSFDFVKTDIPKEEVVEYLSERTISPKMNMLHNSVSISPPRQLRRRQLADRTRERLTIMPPTAS